MQIHSEHLMKLSCLILYASIEKQKTGRIIAVCLYHCDHFGVMQQT